MKIDKQVINNIVMYLSITLFIVLTIINLINHFPWADEAGAWIIAKDINFTTVLDVLHREGHFIVWYLLLVPFAKLNAQYPYPMLAINWAAYLIAVIIMWRKAPFNSIIKIAITFSWLSINYFPIIARCYSVGILGLFVLASLYNKQIKRPYLYSIILVLTAHTSLLATLAVVPLAGIFVYNLFKNKQELSSNNFRYSILILITGIFLWFLPFFNGYGYESGDVYQKGNFRTIIECFRFNKRYLYLYGYLFSIVIIQFFADNKIRIFSIFPIITFTIFFSTIYRVAPHHCAFLMIYLILAFWLTPKLHEINIKSLPFFIIFILLLYWNHTYHMSYVIGVPDKTAIVEYIQSQDKKDCILLEWSEVDTIPYFKDYEHIYIDTNYSMNPTLLSRDVINKLRASQEYSSGYLISKVKINDESKEFDFIKKFNNEIYILYVTPFDISKNLGD